MAQEITTRLMLLARRTDITSDVLPHSDAALLARCARGDGEAFGLIFDRYGRAINGFIYGMVGEGGLAEELTQETFVRAYRKVGALRDAAKLSSWLYGIARNVAREALHARVTKGRSHIDLESTEAQALSGPEPTPADSLLQSELRQVILGALDELDADKRQVFTLKAFQNKSYDEIVSITGFSLSKVKSDLHRARTQMRRLVGPYLEVSDEV